MRVRFITHLNGTLPHAPSYDFARFDLMSTGAWEEATSVHGLKADVLQAWKTRRKKQRVTGSTGHASGTTANVPSVLLMSTHASILVDSVGPPSAEVCRTTASFP